MPVDAWLAQCTLAEHLNDGLLEFGPRRARSGVKGIRTVYVGGNFSRRRASCSPGSNSRRKQDTAKELEKYRPSDNG